MTVRIPIVALALVLASLTPALADPISITQQRALTGGISSGDFVGYPISITDPGSYRLDSDLYSSTVEVAIFVSSPNVTLDFNGFRLSGIDGTINGIVSTQPGLAVEDGSITHFRNYGIYHFSYSLTVENMKIREIDAVASGAGIFCANACLIRDSIISNNNNGIHFPGGSSGLIENNTVAFNDGFQISTTSGLIIGNTIIGDLPITGTDGQLVGFGNNTIISDDTPTGVTPLAPNACIPAC